MTSLLPATTTAPDGSHNNNFSRMKFFFVIAVASVCWVVFTANHNLNPLKESIQVDLKAETAAAGAANAATGQRFAALRVRDFQGRLRKKSSSRATKALHQYLSKQTLYQKCQKWAVVTTIYEPSDAVKLVGSNPEL